MRVILYTGKGGVGKTSIAAATALQLADAGQKVMILSTDQAHSLSDALGVRLTNEGTTVSEGLEAMEIDVVAESEEAWGNLRDFMKGILTSRAEGGIEAEELLVFPGLEELFSLFKILDLYEENRHDVIIVDCAPTGETLSLLKYPELFSDLIEKMLPAKRKMAKLAGPLVEKMTKIPMPKDGVFDDIERLMVKLQALQALMQNKEVLSLRIVSTPEKVVIEETKRNYTWLQLFNYNVDAVIVNKVYPEEALKGYFNQWVKLQEEGLNALVSAFENIPVFKVMLKPHELQSMKVLREINDLYGDYHPALVLKQFDNFRVTQERGVYTLEIDLPFADKTEMDLGQNENQLEITIKNEKRCFQLPEGLKGKAVSSAKFENGLLKIVFEEV